MERQLQQLFSFIEKSPTSFHAVENAKKALAEAGFSPLSEGTRATM